MLSCDFHKICDKALSFTANIFRTNSPILLTRSTSHWTVPGGPQIQTPGPETHWTWPSATRSVAPSTGLQPLYTAAVIASVRPLVSAWSQLCRPCSLLSHISSNLPRAGIALGAIAVMRDGAPQVSCTTVSISVSTSFIFRYYSKH